MARITPAAKALITKNTSFSTKALPRIGRETPIALAVRIEAIAASLYFNASDLFSSPVSDSHVQSPRTETGRMRRKQRNKMGTLFMSREREENVGLMETEE